LLIYRPLAQAAGFKHCTKQGMTARASNRNHIIIIIYYQTVAQNTQIAKIKSSMIDN